MEKPNVIRKSHNGIFLLTSVGKSGPGDQGTTMWRKLGISFPGGSGVAQTGWEVPLTRDGVPSTGRNSSGFLRDVGGDPPSDLSSEDRAGPSGGEVISEDAMAITS